MVLDLINSIKVVIIQGTILAALLIGLHEGNNVV